MELKSKSKMLGTLLRTLIDRSQRVSNGQSLFAKEKN